MAFGLHNTHGMVQRAAFVSLIVVTGCADRVESAADAGVDSRKPARPEDDPAYGCSVDVTVKGNAARLARGGATEIEIDDDELFAKPWAVTSSAPEILAVARSSDKARLVGLAPGTAELVVWRCDRAIAHVPITVVHVADVEVRLSFGLAGRSAPLTTLVGLAGSIDQLEVTYFDAQHMPLAGKGAADVAFAGAVQGSGSAPITLSDHSDGIPREVVPIAIDGPGRITVATDMIVRAIEVSTTPAPARLELELVDFMLLGTAAHALVAFGETTSGQPIAGLAPTFAITPAGAFTPLPLNPPSRQLVLIGAPVGTVTFSATVAGMSATLTSTFP